MSQILTEKYAKAVIWHGGLDVDAAEAAALAHDLGHPPFGHIAEQELDHLSREAGSQMHIDFDGFEGNAQTFRIVVRLATGDVETADGGLNLTRATLRGILKYPWLRSDEGMQSKKWGAYKTEADLLKWARMASSSTVRSLEAEIMDWSDEITYAVADVCDFYRAGAIPLHMFTNGRSRLLSRFFDDVFSRAKALEPRRAQLEEALGSLLAVMSFDESYSGTATQDKEIRRFEQTLRRRYLEDIRLNESMAGAARGSRLSINPDLLDEVGMLKQLTWHYVILAPELANEQEGQRRALRQVFEAFLEASHPRKKPYLFPERYRRQIEAARDDHPGVILRIIVDYIASMSEPQFWRVHGILTGKTHAWNRIT